MGQRATVVAWVASATLARSGPAERSKDNDQKAERAVVHALGPADADRPEEPFWDRRPKDLRFRTRVISRQSRLTPRLRG